LLKKRSTAIKIGLGMKESVNATTYESLSHSKWDCEYHMVLVPKCRDTKLHGANRKFLGPIFHELASQRGALLAKHETGWN
jgi:hypothetical protein